MRVMLCRVSGPDPSKEIIPSCRTDALVLNRALHQVQGLKLSRGNPHYQYSLGNLRVKRSPARKDLELQVDWKLDKSQRCAFAAQKASCILAASKAVWPVG